MPMEKTFDAAEAEPRIYAAWERAHAFRAGANASRADTFCIMIPPPNVTGSLHMGHAFNNTLQDILVRWHRMRGFDTLWQPGQDHAGIATQMVVERELARQGNESRREIGREQFLAKVWEWKEQSGNTIIDQLKRLGASCDWDRNAFTMSGNFPEAVIKVFVDMYDKGLIYRGKRLVNWDPHFETAISDLEVEQTEIDGHMWHFKYPLENGETYEYVEKDAEGNVTLREVRDYIAIATTRPETMLGDGAVAVHPSDERYWPIIGRRVLLPLADRYIPIIADEYPDPAFGSGAVKITGAHDFNDYQVAKRHGIPMFVLMDGKARMRDDDTWVADEYDEETGQYRASDGTDVIRSNLVPEAYRGLDRYAARQAVIDDIEAQGLLDFVEAKKIMQPFGDRSKVVIEPMLTDQWFVDTAQIVGPAIEAVRDGRTKILPEQHEKTYFHWLETIEPWCISRQLWWGHQIPVWYGLNLWASTSDGPTGDLDEVDLGALLLDGGIVHAGDHHHAAADFAGVADLFHADIASLPQPLNAARVVEVADKQAAIHALASSLADYAVSEDPTHLIFPVWRDPDVLDTWFSSGLWPIGTLGWPEDTRELRKYFPTDVLVTGFDIIFFWVARMMMMQLAVVGEVPFHTVYVHALVRDEKGKKMSKSLGNVLDPLDLIDQYGADAVRFTLTAMAAMGRDLKLSKDRIAGYRNFGTKLWNATRFAELNGVFAPDIVGTDAGRKPDASHTVNRWIIGEVARARLAVDEALANYRFNDAANTLYAFVWGKVCDWYVEFAKPLLDGGHAAETRSTMRWVIDQCCLLLHPFMPFITEEIWGLTGDRGKPLVHGDWPAHGAELIDENADREMNWVIALIDEIRSARTQMHVPVGLKLPIVQVAMDDAGRAAWARNAPIIQRLARLDGLTEGAAPKGSITVAVEGGSYAIPLHGIIDVTAEKSRLAKALEKLEKDLGGLRGRLANPKFIDSAPEEIVEETRDKLDLGEVEAGKLKAALARLAEVG